MLKYLPHNQLDLAKWDACLDNSSNGLIYGLSWYLDIVSPGWGGIVKEEAGGYAAVMPVPVARKFGMRYLRQPVFAQQLGVFSAEPLSEHEWQTVLGLLQKHFRFITRYEFNTANTVLLNPEFESGGVARKRFTTHHIQLNRHYKSIRAAYKKDRKWRLNQAGTHGLVIRESENVDLIIRLFDENTAPSIYGVVGEDYEYKLLRQLYRAARLRGLATLYEAATAAGEVRAMIMLFVYNRKLVYIFNASSELGKKEGAISLLLDHVLRQYAGQDLCFDFESPEVSSVAQFYASFGSEEAHFASVSLNNLPAPLRWLKTARTKVVRYLAR